MLVVWSTVAVAFLPAEAVAPLEAQVQTVMLVIAMLWHQREEKTNGLQGKEKLEKWYR
jgi:hypothetical protein